MYEEIKDSDQWCRIEKINKGWSDDSKYYIETADHQQLLLRLTDHQQLAVKKKEYELITRFVQLGFKMSKPVDFGSCNKNQQVYSLLTWVEGEDLETALPALGPEVQYALGKQAGTILKKMHSLEVPADQIPTETKIPKKRFQLQKYLDSRLRVPGDEGIVAFVQNNLDQLWSRPPVYLHGDFHPGNLILAPDGEIGVIDFNRWEIGDPFEEFYKLELFGTDVSIPYCQGQIDGYFDENGPPADFWKVLAVYVAHAALFSIKWAERFGQKDIDKMIEIYQKTLVHYDHFKTCIPVWYKQT
jgi:aminoglycoside phosphotransferase (APT) family kinase protein